MVGLFSMLDALLLIPLPRLVEQLELAPDIAKALIGREDFYGATLALVEAYEAGAWRDVTRLSHEVGIAPVALPPIYREAIAWARTQLQETVTQEAKTRMLRNVSAAAKTMAI